MAPKARIKICRCGNPSCDVDERIRQTSDLLGTSLNGAALILSALKAMSSGTMPGLRAASGSMLLIIELFQTMVDANAGFGNLLHDICNVMMSVARFDVERGGNLSKEMKRAIKELNHQLSGLQAYAEKMKRRCWLRRLINSPRDSVKVAEYREHFSVALSMFQIEIGLDTNYNTRRQNETNWEMFRILFDRALASVKRPDTDLHLPLVPAGQAPYSPQTTTHYAAEYPSQGGRFEYSQQRAPPDYQSDGYQRNSYAGEHQYAQPAQGYYYADNSTLTQDWAPSQPFQSYSPVNNIDSINNANFGVNYGKMQQVSYVRD